MTVHVFTRAGLYALVWAEPMRTVARRYELSDVGLAKACARADVPVPERGYWAKLQHGKSVRQPPLPDRPDLPDSVTIAPPRPRQPPSPVAQAVIEETEPPAVVVPAELRRPHRIVRAWLEENTRRRREVKREGWGTPPADFTAPVEERRLRIYAALFAALEAQGFTLKAERWPDAGATAEKDGEALEFRIYERHRRTMRTTTADERRWRTDRTEIQEMVSAGDLVLRIKTYTRNAIPEQFGEKKAPLEAQLGAVVVGFEAAVVELKAWRRERAEAAEQAHAAQMARLREAERRKLEAERLDRLLDEARAWRSATDLRAYVEAAAASAVAERDGFGEWRRWALARAAALDPLASGGIDLSTEAPVPSWLRR